MLSYTLRNSDSQVSDPGPEGPVVVLVVTLIYESTDMILLATIDIKAL